MSSPLETYEARRSNFDLRPEATTAQTERVHAERAVQEQAVRERASQRRDAEAEAIETRRWLDDRAPVFDRQIMSPKTEDLLARIIGETNEALNFYQIHGTDAPGSVQVPQPQVTFEILYASDITFSAAVRKVRQRQMDNFMYHLAQYFPDCTFREVKERCLAAPKSVKDDASAIQHLLSQPWLQHGRIVEPRWPRSKEEQDIYELMLNRLALKLNVGTPRAMWRSLVNSYKPPWELDGFIAENRKGRLAGKLVDDLRYVRDIEMVDESLKKKATKLILDFASKYFDEFEWYPEWKMVEWKKANQKATGEH